MRWKSGTGSLVFYMGRGESRRGLKACEKSAQLRSLVEEVFALATEIPEEQF